MKHNSDIFKNLPFDRGKVKRIPKILKNTKLKGDKKIIGDSLNKEKDVKIDPIYEDDKIVGVRFICSCGNEAEVYFEYK